MPHFRPLPSGVALVKLDHEQNRRLLCRCPQCNYVWLQQGPLQQTILSPGDIAYWAKVLYTNTSHLPQRVCSACLHTKLQGKYSLVEHRIAHQVGGYTALWEGDRPFQHSLVIAIKKRFANQDFTSLRKSLVVGFPEALAFLKILSHHPAPLSAWAIAKPLLDHLTRTKPPAAHLPEDQFRWHWEGKCWITTLPDQNQWIVTLSKAFLQNQQMILPTAWEDWQRVTHTFLKANQG